MTTTVPMKPTATKITPEKIMRKLLRLKRLLHCHRFKMKYQILLHASEIELSLTQSLSQDFVFAFRRHLFAISFAYFPLRFHCHEIRILQSNTWAIGARIIVEINFSKFGVERMKTDAEKKIYILPTGKKARRKRPLRLR